MNLTQKILAEHLVSGQMIPGEEISIRIDQTLTQDSTGTMAYLQFEAMGVDRVRTRRSVAYIDHNTLQTGFENADDHQYIQTVTRKHGIWCSKPGNGICHQVHLERYGIPGWTLLGSDSHTPTGGGIGMLAIGAGGLDVAVAMGGGAYYLTCPKVVNVHLTGRLPYGVAAKDIILEVLRRLTVKGGVGKVMEYTGPGVATLTVPERATIANMGAELGATTSVFPSDEVTRTFLKAQDREDDWQALSADADAVYDETIEIDLSALEPLVARPHMPDNVVTVAEPGRIAGDRPRQPSGIDDAGAKRRFGGHDGGGCADSGNCVRPVHRHGTEPTDGCGVSADEQPQFLCPERNRLGRHLSGELRNGGYFGADGRIDGSPDAGR